MQLRRATLAMNATAWLRSLQSRNEGIHQQEGKQSAREEAGANVLYTVALKKREEKRKKDSSGKYGDFFFIPKNGKRNNYSKLSLFFKENILVKILEA